MNEDLEEVKMTSTSIGVITNKNTEDFFFFFLLIIYLQLHYLQKRTVHYLHYLQHFYTERGKKENFLQSIE